MSMIFYAESRSPIETIPIRAYPRHADGTQVLVADVDTVDVFVYEPGWDDPIWIARDQATADFLSDTPSTVGWTADTTGWTFHHDLAYGADSTPVFYPSPGTTITIHYVLHLAAGGALEIEVRIPLRDSRAARHVVL